MPTCAFLTTDDLDAFVVDDHLAVPALAALGWQAETVSWRTSGVDWGRFHSVIVRSAWDYQAEPGAFDAVLDAIDRSPATLHNVLDIIRWNLRKTYLRQLGDSGVPIPPTSWGRAPSIDTLRGLFRALDASEIVVKPVVGANAGDVFRLRAGAGDAELAVVVRTFTDRDYLAQPFLPAVVTEGEYSLIHFDGVFSHAILKTPTVGDYRVQEEHGGLITAVTPTAGLLEHARRALAVLHATPLYSRVDLVRTAGDEFALMELELIEPALYFRRDRNSPARFAAAVAGRPQD